MTIKHARLRIYGAITIGLIAAVAAVGGVAATASAAHKAAARGGTLTIGSLITNGSLDPAKANPGTDPVYIDPLYAPLIKQGTNGKLQGVLATSWKYIGKGYKTFQLTLRPKVVFSNGQPVDGAAVAASVKAVQSNAGTGQASWLAGCGNIRATAKLVVEIKCSNPNPNLPLLLDDLLTGGDIVAPASLANPSTLGTDPIGAGEYVLDSSQSVIGSKYVYTANPKYFDQSAIHWRSIVVESIANPTTGLDAVESGQLQQFFNPVTAVDTAAQAAGVSLDLTPLVYEGMDLADRSGSGGSPLENLQVREALEYAVDRPAITRSLFGAFGKAGDELGIPTQPTTWDPATVSKWTYDPTKAKQLLAAAGYPNGFTLNIESLAQYATAAQAIDGYLNAIGVKTNLTIDPTETGSVNAILSKAYPAFEFGSGGLPMGLEQLQWFQPTVNQYNPFGDDNPAVLKLVKTAETAPVSQQTKDWQKVGDYGIDNAWFIGIGYQEVGYLDGKGINVPHARVGYQGNADDVTPAS
jgi:peptide/nickel transport system substrate-binding protein